MYETDEFNELADKLANNLKSTQDISGMTIKLAKVAMERIFELEMEEHIGEKKKGQRTSRNSRNGYTQNERIIVISYFFSRMVHLTLTTTYIIVSIWSIIDLNYVRKKE